MTTVTVSPAVIIRDWLTRETAHAEAAVRALQIECDIKRRQFIAGDLAQWQLDDVGRRHNRARIELECFRTRLRAYSRVGAR